MNASIEAKKAEAVERMKLWGIYPPLIKCFEQDRKDLKSGQPLAWVYNYDEPDWPELGYIGVSLTTAAGLRRAW